MAFWKNNASLKGRMTGIDPANKTFDQLYHELRPELERKSGNNAYARFDLVKGLRIKRGIFNRRGDADVRNKKFSDAAQIFRQSIDNQFNGQMIGDVTVGEMLVRSVLGDATGNGERISAPQIKLLYDAVRSFEKGNEEFLSQPKTDAFSTVAESRVVQGDASIEASERLIRKAVMTELERQPEYRSFKHRQDTADEIMSQVDVQNGLTVSAIDQAYAALQKADPPVLVGRPITQLYEVIDLRTKIETSRRQLMRFNDGLYNIAHSVSDERITESFESAIKERNQILSQIRRLPFPHGLMDEKRCTDLSLQLQENGRTFTRIGERVSELNADLTSSERSQLLHHIAEAYALSISLQTSVKPKRTVQSSVNANHPAFDRAFGKTALKNAIEDLKGVKIEIPQVLWTASNRDQTEALDNIAKGYEQALENSQRALSLDGGVDVKEARLKIEIALSMNDEMLEVFHNVNAIRGDQSRGGNGTANALQDLQQQRALLNLQLGSLINIQCNAEQLQAKIGVARQELARYSDDLGAIIDKYDDEKITGGLKDAIEERNAILDEIGRLPLSTSVINESQYTDLIERLEENCADLAYLQDEIIDLEVDLQPRERFHLLQHIWEAYALLLELQAFFETDSGENKADTDSPDFSNFFTREDLEKSNAQMQDAEANIPEDMLGLSNLSKTHTLYYIANAYDKLLRDIRETLSQKSGVDVDEATSQIKKALAYNGEMLEIFDYMNVRVVLDENGDVKGDRGMALACLQSQRSMLNLQLSCLANIQRNEALEASNNLGDGDA